MKTITKLLALFIFCQLTLLSNSFGQSTCTIPPAGSGCTAPLIFNFISAQDGNWTAGSTWVGGIAPSIENINNKQIKITHNVTVQNGNIKLDNNSVILITDGGRLTLRNGNLYLEDGNQSSTEKLLISNGFLRTSGNVQQNGSATVFCAVGASLEIGDEDATATPAVFTSGLFNSGSSSTGANFQNTAGYRRLENVCLNVTEDMQNDRGLDEYIGVCAEIGDQGAFSGTKNDNGGNSSFDGDDAGNLQFQSSTGTNTKIYDSEFYIPSGNIQNSKLLDICNSDFRLTNGNFQNQSGASITSSTNDIVIWINNSGNGTIQNSGAWNGATISAWRTDNSNSPSGLSNLPAESTSTNILSNFGNCQCGGGGPEEPCIETESTTGNIIAQIPTEYFDDANGNFQVPVRIINNSNSGVVSVSITVSDNYVPFSTTPILAPVNNANYSNNFSYTVANNNTDNATFTGTNTTNFRGGQQDLFLLTVNAQAFSLAGGILEITVVTAAGSETVELEAATCGSITPLPVELTTFTGTPASNGIDLKWSTASEENNDRFEIERSADGKNFEKIGLLKGKGTASSATNYSHLDKHPLKGLNYYRLRQVDFDGKHEFSHIIKITSEKGFAGLGVQLIPNPCSDENCSVLLQGVDASKALVVEMRDLTGRIVFSQKIATDQNSFNLPKAGITKGVYILSAKNGQNSTYQKIIIQ